MLLEDIKELSKISSGSMLVKCKVIANSSKSCYVCEMDDNCLKFKLKSKAQKGEANKELLSLIKSYNGILDAEIIKGLTSSLKTIKVSF